MMKLKLKFEEDTKDQPLSLLRKEEKRKPMILIIWILTFDEALSDEKKKTLGKRTNFQAKLITNCLKPYLSI